MAFDPLRVSLLPQSQRAQHAIQAPAASFLRLALPEKVALPPHDLLHFHHEMLLQELGEGGEIGVRREVIKINESRGAAMGASFVT